MPSLYRSPDRLRCRVVLPAQGISGMNSMNAQRGTQTGFGNNGFRGGMGRGGGPTPPVGPEHHNYRTKTCRYWASGMCKNGDRCSFLHAHESSVNKAGGGMQGGFGGFGSASSVGSGMGAGAGGSQPW